MVRILTLLVLVSMFFSCRNREEVPPRNDTGELIANEKKTGIEVNFNEEPEGIKMIPLPIQGSWKVVEYSKEKNDQTNFFSGFVFTFNPDGSVKATKGDITVSGTYVVEPKGDVNNLIITFPAGTPFPSLNYTWTNFQSSDTEMSFEYTSKDLVLQRV